MSQAGSSSSSHHHSSNHSDGTKSIHSGLDYTDNIFTYLLSLPTDQLDVLYDHMWTCKAVFRFLPDIAKQYIMRLLFCEGIPVKQILLDIPKKINILSQSFDSKKTLSTIDQEQQVVLKEIQDAHQIAFAKLRDYRIVHEVQSQGETFVVMNPHFQKTFRQLVTSVSATAQIPTTHHKKKKKEKEPKGDEQQQPQQQEGVEEPKKKKRKKKKKSSSSDLESEFLQEYSRRKWENVLLYLVGTATETEQIFSDNVKQLLKYSQLIKKSHNQSILRITNEGFQFLLQETKVQVWKLLKQYLETCSERNQNKNEILNFIFELGFLEIGKEYSSTDLTETQQSVLADFNDLGIIYLPKDKKKRIKFKYYYPTPLSSSLTVSLSTSYDLVSSFGTQNESTNGFIIVETNYRVYAYTSSPLQIALLSLFIFPEYRLPNMVVGLITRASIREALKNGISAHQILQFLRLNAHPVLKQKKPVIPDTVSDQILLWEKERDRIKKTSSVLYDKFTSVPDLNRTAEYAKAIGAYLWKSEEKLILVCKKDNHKQIKEFIQQNINH